MKATQHTNPDGSQVTIYVGDDASIGARASIGNSASIGDDARIGDYASIGNYASIGDDARIGNYARIGDWSHCLSGNVRGYGWVTWTRDDGAAMLAFGCETHCTGDWAANIDAICKKYEPAYAADFARIIRVLIETARVLAGAPEGTVK